MIVCIRKWETGARVIFTDHAVILQDKIEGSKFYKELARINCEEIVDADHAGELINTLLNMVGVQ